MTALDRSLACHLDMLKQTRQWRHPTACECDDCSAYRRHYADAIAAGDELLALRLRHAHAVARLGDIAGLTEPDPDRLCHLCGSWRLCDVANADEPTTLCDSCNHKWLQSPPAATPLPSPAELGRRLCDRRRLELLELLEGLTGLALPRRLADHDHATAMVRQWRPGAPALNSGDGSYKP